MIFGRLPKLFCHRKKTLATNHFFCYCHGQHYHSNRKEVVLQICGRDFTPLEIDWINEQVQTCPDLNRVQLSKQFCRQFDWTTPGGGIKEMSCRVAFLRLEQNGLIRLPAVQKKVSQKTNVRYSKKGEPQQPIHIDAGKSLLCLELVKRKTAPLFNELIQRYHYLGYSRMCGAQMRFFVHAQEHLVGLLGFSAAAWRVAGRDDFIGWNDGQRTTHLHRVVNNSRFLILPWVQGKNLASRILAHAARKLPGYWRQRYGYEPFLLETFVEKQRFAGTCYKAANWICVGDTLGRGKWDRHNQFDKPIKSIWLYPLDRRYKERICR
jgi:hypothetical protein